ncbi:MAG: hypothetical protein COS34_13795 [Lysobacterales bacterium CG02_land_8_20_14_3_00_62_12]|nr:MAG: hypothetical protein COS34_13795 [Xanthomonadales bacterium CG02_land_8_20_14_3_00_62_12]PJA42476.1 MAG: hypothetical protein CO182_02255 [Xanthomonadales bacterium CG_4_9_14_3_um_filter_62_6]
MKKHFYIVALLVFLASLAYNAWYWGGAAQLADVGPLIRRAAEREAPLVQTYLLVGDRLLGWSGQQAAAAASAEAAFAPARARLLAQPELVIADLFGHHYSLAQSTLRFTHWLCPVALLVFLIAWARRPQSIKMKSLGRR